MSILEVWFSNMYLELQRIFVPLKVLWDLFKETIQYFIEKDLFWPEDFLASFNILS